jgi:membrane-bound lytic murein transglycosylase D
VPEPVGMTASSVYGGYVYKVRKGDTLASIAKRYDTTVADLVRLNGLTVAAVRVGQRLVVKAREESHEALVATQPKQVAESVPNSRTFYVVKGGDSLFTIARAHGMSVEELRRINGLKGNSIKAGQKLGVIKKSEVSQRTTQKLEKEKTYLVRKGDTLWKISKSLGVSVADLQRRNNLGKKNLKVGQKLVVP